MKKLKILEPEPGLFDNQPTGPLFPPDLRYSGNCTCGTAGQDVDRDCPMHYPKTQGDPK